MKVSISWLKDYVPIEMETDQLVAALTMAGLEVDAVSDRYAFLDTVVVGHITQVRPHPQADKLVCCQVDIGDRSLNIVCGAPNAAAGMYSPLALAGTELPDDKIIKSGKIRGETSEGMLCSAGELVLSDDFAGIMDLDNTLTVGQPLNKALGLSDAMIEIDLTPNRPDCLSLLGVAREVAALQGKRVCYPEIKLPSASGDIHELTSVTVVDPDHCPRYTARLVDNVTVGPSPFWLQDRLLSVGLRPINNIVDITNFVMMETGQPLHAFDFDQLAENRIVVKTAAEGQAFTTLDGKERSMAADSLMICDGEKAVGVGGVMGGLNSEIESTSTRVLIESAYFSPTSIRKTAKRLGLGTDASHRFERGVDPEGTLTALNRCAALVAELGGGRLLDGTIDEYPTVFKATELELSVAKTERLLGIALDTEKVLQYLESIEFKASVIDEDTLKVTAPTYRVDVSRPEDLMEEVARLSGYNNIPTTFPPMPTEARTRAKALMLRNRIKTLMTGLGFFEAITYSFVHEQSGKRLRLVADDPRMQTVPLLNPLTEDQTVMRTSIMPGLIDVLKRNVSRQIKAVKMFEIGKIFLPRDGKDLPQETEILAGLWTGLRTDPAWHGKDTLCDFYDLKGAVEGLLAGLEVKPVHFTAVPGEACTYTRPGYSARIMSGQIELGLIGELHPLVMRNFDLKQSAFIFELNLDLLADLIPETKTAQPIPKFPATSRDVTLIVDQAIESQSVLGRVIDFDEPLVESLHLFDVFEGDPIPSGKKSISFRITYRSAEATLEDDQINQLHQTLGTRLLDAFDATLPI